MVKITFLGTSGSTPTVNRSMPSIALKTNELTILDCGEGAQRQMMKYKIGFGSIDRILLSHLHLDHILGVFGLIETLYLSFPENKPLPIYAPRGFSEIMLNRRKFIDVIELKTGEFLKTKEGTYSAFRVKHHVESFGFVFQENDGVRFYEEKAHKLGLKGKMFTEIQEKGYVSVGKTRINLEDVTYMKKGRKIVYSGDCVPSASTIKAAKDADLLIHDSTYSKDLEKEAEFRGHSTTTQAAEIAKEAGVKQLVLTHISSRYNETEQLLKEAKAIFPNTVIAEDGLVLEIKH